MARRNVYNSQLIFISVTILSLLTSSISSVDNVSAENYVLTLDHTNFSQAASDHSFLVVQFYAPCEKMHKLLCKYVEELAPEYEKAASLLSTHDPPIVLAKMDGSAEENKEVADRFEVTGYPTIVVLQNGGRDFHDYAGPREADGIVRTLKRLVCPPSTEIKTAADALSLIDKEKISIVGIFSTFSGEEFDKFTVIANEMLWDSWDFDVFHTTDASLLPRGESSVTTPTLRLLKPYDELFVDSQNFQVHDMRNFIIDASFPLVEDNNTPSAVKQWLSQLSDEEVTLFVDSDEHFNVFKIKLQNVAAVYKRERLRFSLSDLRTDEDVLEYYGLRFDQVPLIIIHSDDGSRYMKANIKPDDISSWLNEYKDGKLKRYLKSQPIPETNNEPLKVVVADSLQDMVLNSQKNVLLDIDVPSCARFRNFAALIPEIAVLFENDDDVIVARLDGATNDIPNDMFDVRSCYTLYFKPANGTLLPYDGAETKEDIITFIRDNRPIHNMYLMPQSVESVTVDDR
ncbi:putative protein disulfide-isomerase [Helianthus annuus]|uniref:Putative PDI-like 1-1 n=1 Tax=Helianthus annuus TaxID=4232 RepID=A0A251S5S6_HELAN|nr:protein disulfide-isomerase [Helianthus annuus]KAF5763223.1 putative protein disulfide-isomerase [Helianthus annuus]KAJ0450123.1 putative protein disulfide-isomerase [Helianthus annuus]KAJ0471907.1 putative protein disulfide-isomerase [Helianthus annuus]KAJ0647513.1 putative protein disulfide-isomerase [Helianthus annuus]KAJ0651388.1 putative protein disulfide-isomerase [Helianthus annuus]